MTTVTQPSFDPGVHASGVPVTVNQYSDGSAGIDQSIAAMCLKMREGRNDHRVRRWALETLAAAGIDGRGHHGVREKVEVLLEAFRAQTVYSADPVGTEFVPSAAATLCLDPALCVRGDDCDGLSTAFGSVTLSIGIPTVIVKQEFGGGQQQHVLVAVEDESGEWLYADPSTHLPVGTAAHAMREERFDPMDSLSKTTGTAGNEIVTLGRPMQIVEAEFEEVVSHLGAPPRRNHYVLAAPPATAFDAAQIDLSNLVSSQLYAGEASMAATPPDYVSAVKSFQAGGQAGATRVGPEIDLAGAAWVTQPLTQRAWSANSQLAAVDATAPTLEQAEFAQAQLRHMLALYEQAINDGITAVVSRKEPPASLSIGRALLWAGGLGTVAGIGYALLKPKKKRAR